MSVDTVGLNKLMHGCNNSEQLFNATSKGFNNKNKNNNKLIAAKDNVSTVSKRPM